MSGSFKKTAKAHQKIHRERSQPAHRAHLGQLEKHKDYVERARDHHKKRDKIKALRIKAANRNPDEFYFNMVNSEKVDGIHQEKEKETTTPEQELLLQRGDLRYVTMKRNMELKKIERLQAELQFLDPQFRRNRHILFVETQKDVSEAKEKWEERRKLQLGVLVASSAQHQEMEKKYGMLAKRYDRLKELTTILEKLSVSIQLAKDKTGKRKLVRKETKDSAAVYRWCFKRKR